MKLSSDLHMYSLSGTHTATNNNSNFFLFLNLGQRHGPKRKNTDCSSRGRRLSSQHPHESLTPVLGDPVPFLASVGTVYARYTDIHTGKALIHIKLKIKKNITSLELDIICSCNPITWMAEAGGSGVPGHLCCIVSLGSA